jgi:hypothetical protein
LSVSVDIYKQRFGGIVKLCSSASRLITGRSELFNEEEDDLLDTVHDFSSAMYDNFHHLRIIPGVRVIVRERRHRVHIVLGAVRKQRQLRSYLQTTHPVKTVEWTIDSIKIRGTRVPDTYNDSERIDFILRLRMMTAGHHVHVKPSIKRLNGRVYTQTNVSRSIWVMTH